MDCYLCGASNIPDAEFCARCAGQLLKIGLEESPSPPAIPDFARLDAATITNETADVDIAGMRPASTISSVEHRRLEAALGMSGPGPGNDRSATAPRVVTARPQADIPVIGTSVLNVSAARANNDEASPVALVLLVMLVFAVGWLAWNTLAPVAPVIPAPENLAYGTTTSTTTTTTTTAPARSLTVDEIAGRFSGVFVQVSLYTCPSPEDDEKGQNLEAIDERVTQGIVLNEYNVIIPASLVGTAEIAKVQGRLGSTTIARLNVDPSGAAVATTIARINRNLQLEDEPVGADKFYVTYNFATNTGAVNTLTSTADLEFSVTDQGDATSVRLGSRVIDRPALLQLSEFRTGRDMLEGTKNPKTPCDEQKFLIDTSPAIVSAEPDPDNEPDS